MNPLIVQYVYKKLLISEFQVSECSFNEIVKLGKVQVYEGQQQIEQSHTGVFQGNYYFGYNQ